ncbi:MAG: DUF5615 family PIN-like protein [Nitrospirae bacterium]|nr:DUF5615 family PIN-like protein [Nitrospirota bacterium]
MKLFFGENLSPKLVQALEPEYPGSAHVRALGLRGATDAVIWERARQDAYAIVSKDNDFRQLSFLHGAPPKVIWLSVGNAGTETILYWGPGRLGLSRRSPPRDGVFLVNPVTPRHVEDSTLREWRGFSVRVDPDFQRKRFRIHHSSPACPDRSAASHGA